MSIDEGIGDRPPRRYARSRAFVLWLVFGAVLATAGAAVLVIERMDAVGAPAGDGRTFSCVQLQPAARPVDAGYCERLVRDLSRRPHLTERQSAQLAVRAEEVQKAVDQLGRCVEPVAPPYRSECVAGGVEPRHDQPTDDDADLLARALVEAGFDGAVARIAGRADPAPVGTILYAVPVGDGCVLGHLDSLRGGGTQQTVGRLPGGRCLAG
jgi:hypothetical protein